MEMAAKKKRNEIISIETEDEEKKECRHQHDNSFIFITTTVPTGVPLNPSKEQEIDLRQMEEQDLKALKRNGE